MTSKNKRRLKIKKSIRTKIFGTTERPRLSIFRSNRQIYVQVIDDTAGNTLLSTSSLKLTTGSTPKKIIASKIGDIIAQKAQAAGLQTVVFDRNGYLYHGKIKELADAVRNGGLKF